MADTMDPSTWRRTTAGGIPYKLVEGFPKITGDESKASATEKYIIRASDVEAFFAESIPAPIVYLETVYWPARRPMPGASILITKSVAFEPHVPGLPFDPFDADSGAPSGTYDPFCSVSISYETMQNESDDEQDPNDPETFLEHSVTAGGEFMSWPPNNCKLQPGVDAGQAGDPAEQEPIKDRIAPIVKTIPTIEHVLKWKNCLRPAWPRIVDMLGHVNDREFVFSGKDTTSELAAEKHCLLFMGVSGNQSYLWDGASVGVQPWTLDFRFTQKQIIEGDRTYGHNHIYSPKDGAWVQLLRADGQTLLLDANLVKLFVA